MSDSYLNLNSNIVAFSDASNVTNNALLRHFDWTRNINGITVSAPKSEQRIIPPLSSLSIFNNLRTTSFDGTTQIQTLYLTGSTYRFKYTGTGTDPVFAANNPLSFVGAQVTVVTQLNQTVKMTGDSAIFGGVVSGSYIYIYNSYDTVTPAFSLLNSGVWVVLANTNNTTLTLSRPTGTAFSSVDEVVTCSATDNMINYSLTAVQVGDKVRVDSPFSLSSRAIYTVAAVTSKWVDVISTTPIVEETLLATASGMIFYNSCKRFIRVEVDQRSKVYLNGSASETQELDPWTAGDQKLMAWQERIGPVWSLTVNNLSSVSMVCNVFTCE